MDLTRMLAKIVGPVLLLRACSIAIDRPHFVQLLRGLETEVTTISFSMVPIAILMACIALALADLRPGSLATLLLRIIAWGGIVKCSALILFPHAMVAKAHLLEQAGFLNVVLAICFVVGGYFTWVGYFEGVRTPETGRVPAGT